MHDRLYLDDDFEISRQEFREFLLNQRFASGLSQREMAAAIGIPASTYKFYELGYTVPRNKRKPEWVMDKVKAVALEEIKRRKETTTR